MDSEAKGGVMTREEITNAIVRSNKLGARGIQVVGYLEPQTAIESPELKLITQIPRSQAASEVAWYD